MRRAFATPELLIALAILCVAVGLSLPVLAAMKSGRLSPVSGMAFLVAIAMLFGGPWLISEWSGRREMRRRDERTDDSRRD